MYAIYTPAQPIKPTEMLEFSHGGLLKFKYKGKFVTIKMADKKSI